MPVTAKLSKAFYEKMGDQVTTELVEWFNSVDATYRSDLRETNELNFARFDAKVEQRFADQDLKIEVRFATFDRHLSEFESRLERRVSAIEVRLTALEGSIDARFAESKHQVEQLLRTQGRWFVGLWITTALAFIALFFKR
jgi:hypothetical protein